MQLVYKGTAHAFEVIYDRHSEAAFSLALRICGQRALAEDVTQEAFLSLWRSRARYDRGRGSVRNWVLGIVHNRAIDAIRRRSVRDRGVVHDEGIEAQLPAPERTDLEVARREEAREVRDALGRLPKEQSRVIELAYFGGLTHVEIASLLNTPVGTVKGRMRLGLTKMRSTLRATRGGAAMSSVSGTGDHDAFYDAAAAYVLGALVDEDLERFTVHLEGCTACREEVARLQVAADALPLAAPQFTPPPALKQRIMVAVGAGAGEREAEGAGEAFQAHEVEDDVPAPRVGRSRPARRSANGSPRRWTVGAVGALAAAAIVLAVVALAGSGSNGGGGSRVVLAQVLAHGASASLRVSGGRAELLVNGMPQVPARRTYQVWVQRGAAPQPTDALFSVSSSGGATVAVPGGIAGVKAVLVTAEPLGGSRTPTLPALIVARLG